MCLQKTTVRSCIISVRQQSNTMSRCVSLHLLKVFKDVSQKTQAIHGIFAELT